MLVYDETYMKARSTEFIDAVETNFLVNKIPKESVHYTCIACITIDSVVRMGKKNYL